MTKKIVRHHGARMNGGFAVFNCHINNAHKRADAEFISQFGILSFNAVILPLHRTGIMAIFNDPMTIEKAVYIAMVTLYVNEDAQ